MIKVDIAQIERTADLLAKAASDAEELFCRFKQITNELQEDVVLSAYIQSDAVLEAVGSASEKISRGNDTLCSLRNIMRAVTAMYEEHEQKNIAALNRMLTVMEGADRNLSAALTSERLVFAEHSDAVVRQNIVQTMLTESSENMTMTNLAAIGERVKAEYVITSVKDFVKEQ